jgi:hypothetical protein
MSQSKIITYKLQVLAMKYVMMMVRCASKVNGDIFKISAVNR